MVSQTKSNMEHNFILQLENSTIKNIDVGFIENNLFGESDILVDENGIKNRKIKINRIF